MAGRGKKLALSAATIVGLLAVGELGARVAVARLPRFAELSATDWHVLTPDTGWERRPGYEGKVYGVWRSFGERGVLAADVPELASNRPRVVLLGDSCTFGHRVALEETFAELLETELDGVDVVNLGVPGYSSFQALALLEKVALSLEPDVIVFSTNYNDRRYVLREVDAAFDWEESARVGSGILARSRLVRVLRRLAGRESEEEERPVRDLDVLDLRPRVSAKAYRENLKSAATAVHLAGADVVFLLLGDSPDETERLYEGEALRDAGEGVEAERVLAEVAEAGGHFSVVARLGWLSVLRELGREAEVEVAGGLPSFIPSLHGGVPLLGEAVYQEAMRQAARETGAVVVDGAAELEPGDYFDFCHFGASGHAKIAFALAEALRPLL